MTTNPMGPQLARLHADQLAREVRRSRRPRGILRRRHAADPARQVTGGAALAGVQTARPGCSP
jgi:hypothetical protein